MPNAAMPQKSVVFWPIHNMWCQKQDLMAKATIQRKGRDSWSVACNTTAAGEWRFSDPADEGIAGQHVGADIRAWSVEEPISIGGWTEPDDTGDFDITGRGYICGSVQARSCTEWVEPNRKSRTAGHELGKNARLYSFKCHYHQENVIVQIETIKKECRNIWNDCGCT